MSSSSSEEEESDQRQNEDLFGKVVCVDGVATGDKKKTTWYPALVSSQSPFLHCSRLHQHDQMGDHCCGSSGSLTALCHFNCARLCNLWQDYVIEFISTLIEFQKSKKDMICFPQCVQQCSTNTQFDVFSLFQSISFRPPLTLNHC